ncbi:MAG TPA: Fe-S cluster assembly protein SufD [Nocardioidaceae bacterium]
MTDKGTAGLAGPVETVESHLHPAPSYDLADHPMPVGTEEVWRFTPLKRVRGLLADEPSDARLKWDAEVPAGVTIREISSEDAAGLGEIKPADRPSALAVANAGGAVLVDIPAEAELAAPLIVRLSGMSADETVWGHVIVRVGNHAKAQVVFEHSGSSQYSAITSVLVGDGATLDLVSLQLWEDDAVHLGQIGVRVGRDAHVRTFQASVGGDVVRINENAEYDGPGGELEMYGLYFADAHQHLEHRLFVDHNAPHTKSNVVYKGGLQGKGAHSVWVGDVLIRKAALGIETFETNRNLVLTDGCRADSVPNLEIETGEIQGAGHASATGRFDDEQLFYLQSRGITEDEARRLVVHGFFADIVRKVGIEEVETRLMSAVETELAQNVGMPVASAVGA